MSLQKSCPSCTKEPVNNIGQARICATRFDHSSTDNLKNIIDNHQSQFHLERLSAAFLTSKIWKPKSEIKIAFLNNGENTPKTSPRLFEDADPLTQFVYDNPPIIGVKKIIRERYDPITNLTFTFVDDPADADVKINFVSSDGAWSLLGTDCLNAQGTTLNLGWIDCPTILHELGHLLGLFHEHQNPRGAGINWNEDAVYNWASETQGWDKETTDVNIFQHYDLNLTNGSVYDPLSIMLYFFPGYLTNDNKGTRINSRLSATDVLWINNVYGKDAPMTAEEFYPKVYGITLKEGLELSKKAGATLDDEPIEFYEKQQVSCSKSYIFIFVILCVLMVLLVMFMQYY